MNMAESIDFQEGATRSVGCVYLTCDMCRLDQKTVGGVCVCVDCMEALCDDCFTSHSNNEALKAHRIVPKEKLPPNFTSELLQELKDIIFCSVHDVQFDHFCEDHSAFVCQGCTRKAHRTCKHITKIQSSAHSVLNELEEMRTLLTNVVQQQHSINRQDSVEQEKQEMLNTTIKTKVQTFLDHCNTGRRVNERDLGSNMFIEAGKMLSIQEKNWMLLNASVHLRDTEKTSVVSKRIEHSLLSGVTVYSKTVDTGCHSRMNKITDRLELFDNGLDQLVNVCSTDNSDISASALEVIVRTKYTDDRTYTDVYMQTEDVNGAIATPDSRMNEDLKYSADAEPDSKEFNPDLNQRGGVTLVTSTSGVDSKTSPTDCGCRTVVELQQSSDYVPMSEKTVSLFGTRKICLNGETECSVVAICVLKSEQIALLDRKNGNLKLYDGHFNFQTSHSFDFDVVDMCAVDDGFNRIAISFDSRVIGLYEVTTDSIHHVMLRKLGMDLSCRGICSLTSNTIAVLVSNVENVDDNGVFSTINSRENILDILYIDIKTGRIIRSIDPFDSVIRDPVYIMHDGQNNIVISEQNQLSAFDKFGHRVWYYRSSMGHTLHGLLGITMDHEDNIYVCNGDLNNVHQVSSRDYTDNRVIIPDVPCPIAIAYDPYQGRLLVASRDSKHLSIYKFD